MVRAMKPVYLLVDWDNARKYVAPEFGRDPRREILNVMLRIQQQVARHLSRLDGASNHRVTMRLYYGWHNGRSKTPLREAFEAFSESEDLARRIARVSFIKGFQFGDNLCCFESNETLFSTFRNRGQKMVDTSIVCDIFELLKGESANSVIILSDDDDFVPAVLMAQSWKKTCLVIRRGERGIEHITDRNDESILRYWSDND